MRSFLCWILWLSLILKFAGAGRLYAQPCLPPLGHVYTLGQASEVPARSCYSIKGDSITVPGVYRIQARTIQGWLAWGDTISITKRNGCLVFSIDSTRTGWYRLSIEPIGKTNSVYFFDYALLPARDISAEADPDNPYGFNTQVTETTGPLIKRSGAGWVHFEEHLTADTNSRPVQVRFEREGDSLICTLPVTPWALLGDNTWIKNTERGIGFVTATLIDKYKLNGALRIMRTPTELQDLDLDGFPRNIEHWEKRYTIRRQIGPFRFKVKRGIKDHVHHQYLYQFPPPDKVIETASWNGTKLPVKRSDQAWAWAARRRLFSKVFHHLDSTAGNRIQMVEAVYEPSNFLFPPWPATAISRTKVAPPANAAMAATQKFIIQTAYALGNNSGKEDLLIGATGDIPMSYPYPNAFFNEVFNGTNRILPDLRIESRTIEPIRPLGQKRDASRLFGKKPHLSVLTFHPYPGNAPAGFASNAAGTASLSRSTIQQDTDSLRTYYQSYLAREGIHQPPPEVWATETGYPSGGSKILNQFRMTEERQARYLPILFLEEYSAGVDKVFWYLFRDQLVYDSKGTFRDYDLLPPRFDPTYDQYSQSPTLGDYANWDRAGLVRSTNTVKPAYAAFATLSALLPKVPSPFKKTETRLGYQKLTKYEWTLTDGIRVVALYKDDPLNDTLISWETEAGAGYMLVSPEGATISSGLTKGGSVAIPLNRDGITYLIIGPNLNPAPGRIPISNKRYSAFKPNYNASPTGKIHILNGGIISGFAADSNLWEMPVNIRVSMRARTRRILMDTVIRANLESEIGYRQLGLPGDHGFAFTIPQKWKSAASHGRRIDISVDDYPRRKWIRIGTVPFTNP